VELISGRRRRNLFGSRPPHGRPREGQVFRRARYAATVERLAQVLEQYRRLALREVST
jgi:hypothetical protein